MAKKNFLDVSTKGWSDKDKNDVRKKVREQNYKWEAYVITKEGEKKWCYFNTKVDLELSAIAMGFKILKVKEND